MRDTKSFEIPRQWVYDAWLTVRANKGAAGVDGISISDFEADLKNNLYKVWNRMSSGSYFPPPVKRVTIPKASGGERHLGVPTVADRVAQAVVKRVLEPELERIFHSDSYGYRPRKSAHDALAQTRQRCWQYDWVIDLDVKGFFDNIDHELMMKAVRKHTDSPWMLLYIERWLKVGVMEEGGAVEKRDKGTPQGGVISPLLANLFLHYSFDAWIQRKYPHIVFERYADDIIVHCQSKREAEELLEAIKDRMEAVHLELHPEKTKIVYCKDARRTGDHEHIKFDFLGYTFRPRKIKTRQGKYSVGFTPAISNKAAKQIREIMRSWKLDQHNNRSLEEIARYFNPRIRGWINYYGRFRRSELYNVFESLDQALARWVRAKYKPYRDRWRASQRWLCGVAEREPTLFAHWHLLKSPPNDSMMGAV